MTDVKKLRELAEAATRGPWRHRPDRNILVDDVHTVVDGKGMWVASFGATPEDAAFCAAANPTAVLALLNALDAANRELERWRHGATVEGDFVCPDSLALTAANAEIERLQTMHAARDAATKGWAEAQAELVAENERLRLQLDVAHTAATLDGDTILHQRLSAVLAAKDEACVEVERLRRDRDSYDVRLRQTQADYGEVAHERDALLGLERISRALVVQLRAARDEACDIAERLGSVVTTETGRTYQWEHLARIAELRKVGR